MRTFLEEKIEFIYSKEKDRLNAIAIIIPNKRASVYIYKYLAQFANGPVIPPRVLTINEWINELTPERIISQTELLFMLYEVHVRIEGEEKEDFNSFIKWGKMLLSDFDEIDRYLIPPARIFKDLRNIKEIENWSFLEAELSKGQERFLTLWDKLQTYYEQFNALLENQNATYQGKAYQLFHNQVVENESTGESIKHYYFIGFNALSASEEGIIRQLIKHKMATAFFDVDRSYFMNPEHEAGHFYRRIVQNWGVRPDLGEEFNAHPKAMEVIETAQQTAQAKIAGSIVEQLVDEGLDMSKTAIVLADESILIPLTRSLPAKIEKANITMGYPLKFTHLKGLIDTIFEFQFNFQKFKSQRIYHKSLLNLLDHPYMKLLVSDHAKILSFEKALIERNKIFIDLSELMLEFEVLKEVELLFKPWKDVVKDGFLAFNQLSSVIYKKFKSIEDQEYIDLEIMYHFLTGFQKFEKITLQYPYPLNLKAFKLLFYQFWQAESLSFLGNPTEGLQIMGVLETRTIDFENLIVLGMNEGNLPKTNIVNSFIPRDLKLNLGLPVEEDRQAIFAHHFYRLLHRAKRVYFTYNSTPEGIGNSEKSRFITQLENELDWSVGHKLKHFTFTASDKDVSISDVDYKSNLTIQQAISDRLANGLSPSALNTLINCSLDFYYRYILGLKESAGVEETIEASTFGTKIHDVLERIIKENFMDKKVQLDADVLKAEKKHVARYLKEAYLEDFQESDFKYGQNKLSYEVSLGFIHHFIDQQIAEIKATDASIFIVDLEQKIAATFEIEVGGTKKEVKIEGHADRIDQIGSVYRIIDYKSGKCDADKIKLPNKISQEGFEKFMRDEKKGYGRQLLMYALMFRQTYPQHRPFSAGIISMINLDDWLQNIVDTENNSPLLSDDLLDEFEMELKRLLQSLYDPNYVFEHNIKSNYCDHCEV